MWCDQVVKQFVLQVCVGCSGADLRKEIVLANLISVCCYLQYMIRA